MTKSNYLAKSPIEYYAQRCLCRENKLQRLKTKTSKVRRKSRGRPLQYPNYEKDNLIPRKQTFHIKCDQRLSSLAKIILQSFENKYLYYAMDDIFDFCKDNPKEQEMLLAILSSASILLQTNFCVSFSDMWIQKIQIEEPRITNKFIQDDFQTSNCNSYVSLTFWYRRKAPVQKPAPLW